MKEAQGGDAMAVKGDGQQGRLPWWSNRRLKGVC